MVISSIVKELQDIMRKDPGINGDAQRIEQIAWLLFLKVYDIYESKWDFHIDNWRSIIPDKMRWHEWAVEKKDGTTLTGDKLLNFINNELFPTLKNAPLEDGFTMRQAIVRQAFEDNNNYMKDGTLLRKVINAINKMDLKNYQERHAFGEIYETILKSLQSAGNAGEFYTPRAVTDFMAEMVAPVIGERVADFACGTGGFLTSAIKILSADKKTGEDVKILDESIYGVEKKALPHLLCATNMFLHDIGNPQIHHENALAKNIRDYKKPEDKFEVILMNPPYGGVEVETIRKNFPKEMRSSETADLFLALIMARLKENGRAGVIIPDGFLFGNDGAKLAIKQKMLEEFNLHTIVRMPRSVFAPYTSITTNILFFNNDGKTKETWFYRLDMPEGYKNFSKTKPMLGSHFDPCRAWWKNREEIADGSVFKAKCYKVDELKARDYNFDLCGYTQAEEEILPPGELIESYKKKRGQLNAEMDKILAEITTLLQ